MDTRLEGALSGCPGLCGVGAGDIGQAPASSRSSAGRCTTFSLGGTIDQVVVRGDMLTEVAFFHYPSRTLLLTDLIENFELERTHCRSYRLLLRLAGVADPDGKAPFDMH